MNFNMKQNYMRKKYIVSFIKVSWGLFIFYIKFQIFENWSRFFFESKT